MHLREESNAFLVKLGHDQNLRGRVEMVISLNKSNCVFCCSLAFRVPSKENERGLSSRIIKLLQKMVFLKISIKNVIYALRDIQ